MINWDLYKGRDTRCSKKVFEEFCELLESENYKLIGNYVNNKTKVELECDKQHRYFVQPFSFKSGFRCPICSGRSKEHAKLDFIKQVENEGYKLIGDYINALTKIELECDKQHRYFVQPNDFKNKGARCPICYGNHTELAKLDFIKQVENEGYKLIGEYVNNYTKIELECNKHHRYFVQPYSFKNGSRCPHCSTISHGEILAKKILDEYNCKYESQKKFDGLIGLNGGQLSYDFFVDNYLLIEIQGEQHYKPIKLYGGLEQFKQQQEHDRRKREFAKKNGYELLEIPYFNVRDLDKLERMLREKIEDYKHIPKAS
ncbi:hypothetical protein Q4457_05155 [Clostridium perfringens]|uniref:hypothetical protein n=1 Tax=Clostridium perfringens TaxID=1502 RepID=UPI0026E3F724|nr:hypothetical protein [Clostridium perfringens]MDO6336440.1 hypothetical protein [Clostridium perfringens]